MGTGYDYQAMVSQQLIDPIILMKMLDWATRSHQLMPNQPKNAVRKFDGQTNYIFHSLWQACTFASEESLPKEMRKIGVQVLLFHDVLEDTKNGLPEWLSDEVVNLVHEMTFDDGMREEVKKLWDRSDFCILLKLYDKVHSCFFGVSWMKPQHANLYIKHITKIMHHVEKNYGKELTILFLAKQSLRNVRRLAGKHYWQHRLMSCVTPWRY